MVSIVYIHSCMEQSLTPKTENPKIKNMLKRSENHFKGSLGQNLFYQSWENEQDKGTILFIHGYAEHSDCYDRFAEGIKDLGFHIHALDLQGHGRSPGPRGYVRDFVDYVEDFHCFVKHIEKEGLDKKPLILGSHSMGGLIALRYLIDFPDHPFDFATFSSPLLGISVEVPKIKDLASQFMARYLPKLTMNNELNFVDLSRDPEIIASYPKDVLRHEKISAPIYIGMLQNIEYVRVHEKRVTCPCYFQLAGVDKIVSRSASEAYFHKLSLQDKNLKIYEESYHEIFNDLNRDEVYKDYTNFLKKRFS